MHVMLGVGGPTRFGVVKMKRTDPTAVVVGEQGEKASAFCCLHMR